MTDHDVSSKTESGAPEREPSAVMQKGLPALLLLLTIASTTYVGVFWSGTTLRGALEFSVPLMSILLAHELGHYIAARIHRVPASLPFFIPLPLPPLGTMGAVILMPGHIKSRNALLDIGAAGPLAGLAVALPVLAYGIATSEVGPLAPPPPGMTMYLEGHSLLYEALLYALKGPIPVGHDIHLNATAFAGWAGLLVTMLNLIPALQLDGGHVAFALLGEKQEQISRVVRKLLFPLGLGVALYYGGGAYLAGVRGDALWNEAQAGTQWLFWGLLLYFMARRGEREHPETEGDPLSPSRKWVARLTLALFVLLFMPAWLRVVTS
jgi:membrane-associated protease RseP (regulator of RpoE activity)